LNGPSRSLPPGRSPAVADAAIGDCGLAPRGSNVLRPLRHRTCPASANLSLSLLRAQDVIVGHPVRQPIRPVLEGRQLQPISDVEPMAAPGEDMRLHRDTGIPVLDAHAGRIDVPGSARRANRKQLTALSPVARSSGGPPSMSSRACRWGRCYCRFDPCLRGSVRLSTRLRAVTIVTKLLPAPSVL